MEKIILKKPHINSLENYVQALKDAHQDNSVFDALFNLLEQNVSADDRHISTHWTDSYYNIKDDIEVLVVTLSNPEVAKHVPHNFSPLLLLLNEFFTKIGGDLCQAEIELYEVENYGATINDKEAACYDLKTKAVKFSAQTRTDISDISTGRKQLRATA